MRSRSMPACAKNRSPGMDSQRLLPMNEQERAGSRNAQRHRSRRNATRDRVAFSGFKARVSGTTSARAKSYGVTALTFCIRARLKVVPGYKASGASASAVRYGTQTQVDLTHHGDTRKSISYPGPG
jgi:hypothetical protein